MDLYDQQFSYELIPPRTLAALDRYREERILPGHFLQMVLKNQLVDAVSYADRENLNALPMIARYVQQVLPSPSWGSQERINEWISSDD